MKSSKSSEAVRKRPKAKTGGDEGYLHTMADEFSAKDLISRVLNKLDNSTAKGSSRSPQNERVHMETANRKKSVGAYEKPANGTRKSQHSKTMFLGKGVTSHYTDETETETDKSFSLIKQPQQKTPRVVETQTQTTKKSVTPDRMLRKESNHPPIKNTSASPTTNKRNSYNVQQQKLDSSLLEPRLNERRTSNNSLFKLQISNIIKMQEPANSATSRGGTRADWPTTASSRATNKTGREPDNLAVSKYLETLDSDPSSGHSSYRKRATQNFTNSQKGVAPFMIEPKKVAMMPEEGSPTQFIENEDTQGPPANSRNSLNGTLLVGKSSELLKDLVVSGMPSAITLDRGMQPPFGDKILENHNAEEDEKGLNSNFIGSLNQSVFNQSAFENGSKEDQMLRLTINNRRLTEELALEKEARKNQYFRLSNEIEVEREKYAALQREYDQLTQRVDTFNPDNGSKQKEANKTKMKQENEKLKTQIKELEEKLEAEKTQNQDSQKALNEMRSQFASQAQQLIEGLAKEAAQRELQLREELKKKNEETENLKNENNALKQQKESLLSGLKSQGAEIGLLQQKLKEAYLQAERMKSEYLRLDQAFRANSTAFAEETDRMKSQLAAALRQHNSMKEECEHLRTDIGRIRVRNKELLAEIELLEADKKVYQQQAKELKVLKIKEVQQMRRASFVPGSQSINKGFFRLKQLTSVVVGLKQAVHFLDELIRQIGEECKQKASSIRDQFKEELSQLEVEIQYMNDHVISQNENENEADESLELKADIPPLTRNKSFTLGKGLSQNNEKSFESHLKLVVEPKDTISSSFEVDRTRFSEEENIELVYKELRKLSNFKS